MDINHLIDAMDGNNYIDDLKLLVTELDSIITRNTIICELPIDCCEVKNGVLLIKINKNNLLKSMNLK